MTAQPTSTPRPRRATRTERKVDKGKAIELKMNGNSYTEIAKIMGCHPSAVHNAIRHLLPTNATEIFKRERGDVLAEMQRKLLVSIDNATIKRMSGGSRILGVAQLYDKERLERNLSTSNTASIRSDIAMIKGLTPIAGQQNKPSTKAKKQSTKDIKQIAG